MILYPWVSLVHFLSTDNRKRVFLQIVSVTFLGGRLLQIPEFFIRMFQLNFLPEFRTTTSSILLVTSGWISDRKMQQPQLWNLLRSWRSFSMHLCSVIMSSLGKLWWTAKSGELIAGSGGGLGNPISSSRLGNGLQKSRVCFNDRSF